MATENTGSGRITLKTNIDIHPVTRALRDGKIHSSLVDFGYADLNPAHKGFKAMVREQAFDLSEMAIMTYLQAKAFGKPLVLLPAVVMSRFQHHNIIYNSQFGEIGPADLHGRRVAIRSYSQTTGVWVRGILAQDYGVDLDQVTWVCFDDGHLAEYADPGFVERGPAGKGPVSMLISGEVDAAILGADLPKDERLRPLIPDPHDAARDWHGRHGIVPVNHMLAVTEELARSRPDVVKEVFRLFSESKRAASEMAEDDIDFTPIGVEANRKGLELALEYAVQQKIIPRVFDVEELFDSLTIELGA
ncbi:phosphate ABC transporter substrate-binding protein [Aliiruegeria lutimaris]|uniref:4,5-dihydroxyphthalate decarboxylase n=1 Tax=Aliiruegeria lutimaris TaxID=571298 RepID=A0A1G9AED1_9RHOB|nr:phosphate ABC transporter substrate-binding protein [Aliiruegeria lutimaris]SDK25696.1 4,5-dihydroxyphthalate decarboxylase [Aliiruegeria lutimaris]